MAISVSSGAATITNGTHTWDEVVTAIGGASQLVTHSALGRVYTYTSRILVSTGGVLNISNISIHLLQSTVADNTQGCFHSVNGGILTVRDSLIRTTKRRSYNQQPQFSQIAAQDATSQMRLINTSVSTFADLAASTGSPGDASLYRVQHYPTLLENCKYTDASVINSNAQLIIQPPGRSLSIAGSDCRKHSLEVSGAGAAAEDSFFKEITSYTFGTATRTRVRFSNVEAIEPYVQFSEQLGIQFINTPNALGEDTPVFDTFAGAEYGRDVNGQSLFAHNLRIADAEGGVEGALVSYVGFDTFSGTSNSSGSINFEILNSEYDPSPLSTDNGSFSTTVKARLDRSTYTREIKSYRHLAATSSIIADSPLGTSTLPLDVGMLLDAGVSEPDISVVAAYSGITTSNGSVTLSGSLNLEQVYDSRKLYWRTNSGVTAPLLDGDIARFGATNITINAPANNPAATDKFTFGSTTGNMVLGAAGDYTASDWRLAPTSTVTVQPGETDLSGWVGNGATVESSAPATVFVTNTGDWVAGDNVTILATPNFINLFGFPETSATKLLVRNLTQETQEFFTVVGTSISIATAVGDLYEIRADAPGYLASGFIQMPGNTPQFQFNLVDRTDIYNAGVTRFDRIIFNPETFLILIDNGAPLTPQDVFRTIEDYLTLEQDGVVPGLLYTAHPFPVTIPGRFILRFPRDVVTGDINPARLQPAPAATSDPELLFEIELEGADDPTYDLLLPGVDEDGNFNGLKIRVRSEVNIATVTISGDGALTTEQAAQLTTAATVATRLDGLVEDDGGDRFTAKALELVEGGGGATPEQIREEIDANSVRLAEIAAKTGNLPSDPASEASAASAIAEANLSTFDPATTPVEIGGYVEGQSPAELLDITPLATTTQLNTAREAILTQGNIAWVTATGFSTLTGGDIAAALADYPVAKPSDVQVTVEPVVNVDGGFGSQSAADLAAAKDAAESAQQLLAADERIRPDRYQKLAPGTGTVILDKDVVQNGQDIDLTEHS